MPACRFGGKSKEESITKLKHVGRALQYTDCTRVRPVSHKMNLNGMRGEGQWCARGKARL